MSLNVTQQKEGIATLLALVRLLSFVSYFVFVKGTGITEGSPTFLTYKGFLSPMHSFMFLKIT
jgi:hypothetical protein